MKIKKIRTLVAMFVFLVVAVGYFVSGGVGTLSAFGWGDVSILCPVGALEAMLATKAAIPRAVVSLVLVVLACILIGRAFCAWICPVPVVSRLRNAFKKKTSSSESSIAVDTPLSKKERSLLRGCSSGCSSYADTTIEKSPVDSRHIVLGASLLSAAVFGFPVFCLICPVGLSFATIFLIILLFAGGDVTWTVVVVPLVLLVEVVFFRRWCSSICPISAFMSLVAKFNRTLRPSINDNACIETSRGGVCGCCGAACEVGIDPRHPELGASWSECTRCKECSEVCPAEAISFPFVVKKNEESKR